MKKFWKKSEHTISDKDYIEFKMEEANEQFELMTDKFYEQY